MVSYSNLSKTVNCGEIGSMSCFSGKVLKAWRGECWWEGDMEGKVRAHCNQNPETLPMRRMENQILMSPALKGMSLL